jgi:hypothetical protein
MSITLTVFDLVISALSAYHGDRFVDCGTRHMHCFVLSMDHDFPVIKADDHRRERPSAVRTRATRDREEILRWAAEHDAEPATGEGTASGPATVTVNDDGAGIRFNFPGFARFRPITWEEWFDNFFRHDLVFVFEELDAAAVAQRAWQLAQSRGAEPGHEQEDWFRAEHELQQDSSAGAHPAAYRLMKISKEPQQGVAP